LSHDSKYIKKYRHVFERVYLTQSVLRCNHWHDQFLYYGFRVRVVKMLISRPRLPVRKPRVRNALSRRPMKMTFPALRRLRLLRRSARPKPRRKKTPRKM